MTVTLEAPATSPAPAPVSTGGSRDRTLSSLVFLGMLWFSLFFGVMVLMALIIDTIITGAPRLDWALLINYESVVNKEQTGFRGGILGSAWIMVTTAVLAIPLGVCAAIHLEEFASADRWYNRVIEVNVQNLAAVPSIIYGMLAVAVMHTLGFQFTGIVLGAALALALLILPVVIITTREALRAVPAEIRLGSLALGATVWQTTWRNTLPSAIPGIATGTILGLSRAIGEAAPLVVVGIALVRTDPSSLLSTVTALPGQIYNLASAPQEAYQVAAAAAIVVLLAMILMMNGLAIYIRNKFQSRW